MVQEPATRLEIEDQLWRLRRFATIAGACLGGIVGIMLALLLGVPGGQGALTGVLAIVIAPAGWFAAREVNQIKELLVDLTETVDTEVAAPPLDICLSCGTPLRAGLAFCTACGQRLNGTGDG